MKKSALYTLAVFASGLTACGDGGGEDDNTSVDPSDNQVQQLIWVAPSTRTDGSFLDLSELAGYKIYSGPSSNNLELIADIKDGLTTAYYLSSMRPGRYFFGIAAYDTDGRNGPISERIEKTITK
ncbi:hypothetical protein A3197_10475 [Candidatus Thiodiazotropha endoloripes]|nr:hypothetical protein A3197_10475 [Candidatus Thiodiazotropha endoloripes]